MGNKIAKLKSCFAAAISRRRHSAAAAAAHLSDEGLGHSFCYIPAAAPPPRRTISGAAVSANASTPLSTADPFACAASTSASSFQSSTLFSSIPLQPIPKNTSSDHQIVKSGPIPNSAQNSGPIERGFFSGPIERSFVSGPLDNLQLDHQLHRYRPVFKRKALIRNFRKVVSKSLPFWSFSKELLNGRSNVVVSGSNSGNSSTVTTSRNLSSEMSLVDENEDVNEYFGGENLQWAQGKAGEDRVHIVVSEESGWVFVGIYDGFNGPDATDFLLNNLYSNVYKEIKGLLSESCENAVSSVCLSSMSLDSKERVELDRKLREKLSYLGREGICGNDSNATTNHLGVLRGLSEALKRTEASYLEVADMMLMENPELALTCVLVMVMKGDDVYLMNVGDSRAVLAQKLDNDSKVIGKMRKDYEESIYGYECDVVNNLSSCQLTKDHSTSVKEEVRRIRNAHPDDALAVMNDRVKGSLKVTRAFGAGFLKQPKWNNALLEMFRIDYIGTSPYITCSPSLCHRRIESKDKFLILSSDGLYQYFTNEEAVWEVEIFMSTYPEGDPAQHLVKELLFRAAKQAGMDFHDLLDIPQGDRRRYHDDVSVIIISFEGSVWRSSSLV